MAAARERAPGASHRSAYRLAGKPVRVNLVGDALADYIGQALAHVTGADNAPPALTIELWDERVTGVPNPLPLHPDDPALPHLSDGELLLSDETSRYVWCEKRDAVTWFDRPANRIIGWRADGTCPPTHEQSKPLTFMVALWLHGLGIQVLHAALVARDGGGVLIAGGSGVGKTTTALACLLAGFDYLGDDQIAVERVNDNGASAFRGHSLYHSARLEPGHLARFPAFEPHALPSRDPLDQKALVLLAQLFPQQMARAAAIRALVLPRVGERRATEARRAGAVDAVAYCGRTSIYAPWGFGRARFETLAQLLAAVPCYWLELGSDLETIPPVIERILGETQSRAL